MDKDGRKTVLLVSDDSAGRGGTEIRLLQTARYLDSRKWRPVVVVPAIGYLHDLLSRAGVDVRVLNFYCFPRFWRVRRHFPVDSWMIMLVNGLRLMRFLRRERIALIHSMAKQTLNVRNVAFLARRMKIPVLWSCGDTNPKVLTYCGGRMSRDLDRVIAISAHVKQSLLGAGMSRPERIEVLHNAMDLDDWDRRAASLNGSARRELGLPESPPVVALVGRLDRVKGQKDFLLSAEIVARSHPEAIFVLVGIVRPPGRWSVFADYYEEIRTIAARPGLQDRVIFAGWQTDMCRVMAAIDILVQPSTRETFGRVLIEAMASRKPAVVTDVGGMPEIVVDGSTGFVVPPGDPEALAGPISSLLEDPERRRTMGEAGRNRMEELFALPGHIHRLESIYERISKDPISRG